MVSTDSREEALEAILMYSESAKQLLRRKKVRREHIFQYLAEKQIYASASADKTTLMRKVLDLWGTPPDVGSTIRDEFSPGMDGPLLSPTDPRYPFTYPCPFDPDYPTHPAMAPPISTPNIPNQLPSTYLPSSQGPSTSAQAVAQGILQVTNTQGILEVMNRPSQPVEGQKLAERFAPWFYSMLNNINPVHQVKGDPRMTFGPQHFWSDVQLSIYTLPMGGHEEHTGPDDVSQALTLLISSGMYFNANLDMDGVKGLMNSQGCVIVTVAGTMHKGADCTGVFKQCFGLVKDPMMENNWRIKFTRLHLISGQATQRPTADQPAVLTLPESWCS
jgi:hypothetical protein